VIERRSDLGRIDPIPPRGWPPEMADALAAMTPPEPRYSVSPPDPDRAKPMNMLGVMAHHPALARAYFTFGGHVLMATTLTERHRELLALRTSALCSCAYEWAQHFSMARDAGLSDEEISRIAFGPEAPFWNELERAILRANDELFHDGVISDDTWAALSVGLDGQQILDLIFTVGSYETLARMMRSVELQLDEAYVDAVTAPR
jgi:AhpD family alkylhydroperoxidase